MNLIQKMHCILISDRIAVWHFPTSVERKPFVYWMIKDEPHNLIGYEFDTLEQMIEAAFRKIDPLKQPLPDKILPPTIEQENAVL